MGNVSQIFKDGDLLVLDLGETSGEKPRGNIDFQLLPPLMLGLLVPFIAAQYFDPEALRPVKWLIWTVLACSFCLCACLFFYTHHYPGRINSIVIDREQRTMEIVWRNLMATASQIVPFQDISALRVRNVYDADGSPLPMPELVLRSRPPIALPDSLSDAQLRPLRAAIGLG